MTTPNPYDAIDHVDEMAAGCLTVLEEVRGRLTAHFPDLTEALARVVDGYAAEIVAAHVDEDE